MIAAVDLNQFAEREARGQGIGPKAEHGHGTLDAPDRALAHARAAVEDTVDRRQADASLARNVLQRGSTWPRHGKWG